MTKQELNQKIIDCLNYKQQTKAVSPLNELILEGLLILRESNQYELVELDRLEKLAEIHLQLFREDIV